jgi:hypothetical protein
MLTAMGCEVITFLTASFKGTDSRYHCDTVFFSSAVVYEFVVVVVVSPRRRRRREEKKEMKKTKKMKKKVKIHSLTVGVRDDPVNFLRVELVDDDERADACQ